MNSNRPSLFKVISDGESSYYQTKDFGDFLETVKFLNMVNRICDRNPDAVPARIMLIFSDQMRLATTKQKRLLYEIDKGTAKQWVRGGPDWAPLHHMVEVNYDADTFTHADMLDEPVTALTGSLSDIIGAYKAATSKINSTQTRFNNDKFSKLLENICTEYTLDEPEDFLTESEDESPGMGQQR